MRLAVRLVLTLSMAVFPLVSWGNHRLPFPGRARDISSPQKITANLRLQATRARTDVASQTAVGNMPATAGRTIISTFTLGNEIKTCPDADGTAEGKGVFSLTVDSTSAQADGTNKQHVEMRANAKYKGEVGDDGYLHGPVNAEIDYTYDQTGTIRGPNGALANTAPSHIDQHITVPFVVSLNAVDVPSLGAFSGGDPTKGHYAEAYGTGMVLAYW